MRACAVPFSVASSADDGDNGKLNSQATVAVATYSEMVFLFAIGHRELQLLGSLHAPFAEASAAKERELLTVRNNCVCPTLNGVSDASCCISSMNVLAFNLTTSQTSIDFSLHSSAHTCPLGPLCGAIFTHIVNSSLIAVANYIGGYVTFIDLSTGRSWLSTPISGVSLMHQVVPDSRCRGSDRIFGVDAGNFSVLTIDLFGSVLGSVQHTKRIRRLTLHPRLPFAYLLYEEDGEFGVWHWPDCVTLGGGIPYELTVWQTLPTRVENKPTSLLITRDGRFLYTCTRTHYLPNIQSYLGVFNVSTGNPVLIQWVAIAGNNTRDCALINDEVLVAADVESNALLSFRIDEATGDLTPMHAFKHASFVHPTMVVPL
jgi:6-phosphogluconolactonase (cycloisomerase 2 family)